MEPPLPSRLSGRLAFPPVQFVHTSDIPTDLEEPCPLHLTQHCAPSITGAQDPFTPRDSFQRSHTSSVCFLLKSCMKLSRTLSPCPRFITEAGLRARGVAVLTLPLPFKSKEPRLARASTPMLQVPHPAEQSNCLGLLPKMLNRPPPSSISTPMNQNLLGWG